MSHTQGKEATPSSSDLSKDRSRLTRYAWLSIVAAVVTIGLKTLAYVLTGSVGLLSDAMESGVNLIAAFMALAMLTIAARPPDAGHAFGHSKAEYFSSGVEGALILVAAASIMWTAIGRLLAPQPLEGLGLGLGMSLLASLLNLGVAYRLLQAGKRYQSITLEADARHLMTDVWTSAGVLAGLGVVAVTRLQILDPIIAIGVAINIIWAGVGLIRRSVLGLMDTAIPAADIERITQVLNRYATRGVQYHAVRTRQSGAEQFVAFHVRVPGKWTVERGHSLLSAIESEIKIALPLAHMSSHLEPVQEETAGRRRGVAASQGSRPTTLPEDEDES
jgi:cation diffusion facilitator family transporter